MAKEESTVSKAEALVEAARKRNQIEREVAENNAPASPRVEENRSDSEISTMKTAAERKADIKVQARVGTLDGNIDVEAMGDVKGDGGDAKDYPDNDPAKALGVPTYEHGLNETVGGVDRYANTSVAETRVSKRTQAELERGRDAVADAKESRERASRGRVVVTDSEDDPDGAKGGEEAEALKKAAAAKKTTKD